MNAPLHIVDAGDAGDLAHPGLIPYRAAWDAQLEFHGQVLSGIHPGGVLFLLEHPPVITIGRRPDAQQHLLAAPAILAARGVELVETDRGGDITFHGPGQLVAYPIINLNTYGLNLHAYMRLLEQVVIDTLAAFNIRAQRDPSPTPATGVWVAPPSVADHWSQATDHLSKIAAIGVKIRRWTTLHGLALNVTTDLSFFDLINPCGLSRPVTSMQKLLGRQTPPMDAVKEQLAAAFNDRLAGLSAAAQ